MKERNKTIKSLIFLLIILLLPLTVSALAPVADFSADPLSGTTATYFTFTDASTNTPTSWYWEYSLDSGTNWVALSSDQNPYITLLEGSNSIRLTATNDDGSDDETKIDYITVTPPPTITVDSITPNTGVNTNTNIPIVIIGTNLSSLSYGGLTNDFANTGIYDFSVISDTEINGYLDLTNEGDNDVIAGEYLLYLDGYEYPEIIFTVTSESEPTPIPTETITVLNCGNLIVYASPLNNESITWHYTPSDNITQISVNGYLIENFDNQTGFFVWRTPPYPSTNTIKIYNETDTGCNTSVILPVGQSEQEQFFGSLNFWFLVGIIILCAIVGFLWLPIIGFIGVILSLLGIVSAINYSASMGVIFFILIIVSAFSTFKN
jgi:PKD repeat protein